MNSVLTAAVLVFGVSVLMRTGALAGPRFTNEEDGDDLALKSEGIIDFFITDRNNVNLTALIVPLFSQLTLNLVLSGTAYSALIPYECYFEDGNDKSKRLLFVVDSCPIETAFPLGKMERINQTLFKMPFKAFAFSPAPVAQLAIYCQITLCIDLNVGDFCNKTCWHAPPAQRSRQRLPREIADSGPVTKIINLIVTDKNYSTPVSAKTTPRPSTSSMLYAMYGLSGFFAFLFFILLIGIIVFLCCSPKKERRSRVVYTTPQPTTTFPVPVSPQYILPSQHIDPVFSNLPGQAPYCDWYTVFRIPRVWTDRNNRSSTSDPGSSNGDRSSDNGSPSTGSARGSSREAIIKKKSQRNAQKVLTVTQVEDPQMAGKRSQPIRYVMS